MIWDILMCMFVDFCLFRWVEKQYRHLLMMMLKLKAKTTNMTMIMEVLDLHYMIYVCSLDRVESNEQLVSMNEIEILNRSLFSKYVRTSTDELNRGGDFFLIIIIDDDDGIDPSFFRPFVINGRKSIADADDGI